MKKLEILIFLIIIIGGFLIRLYRFDAPVADWHSWRQVDTSSVSRNFVESGFDVLHPKFHDLSNVQSRNYDNPEGYRFVEFPIYNVLQAGGFIAFNTISLEEWGRLITITSSIIASIFLFGILKRYGNTQIAFLGLFFYSFLPFNIFWSRTILPDQTAITATLGGVYFFDLYRDWADRKNLKKIIYLALSILFIGSALLLKPFVIFFMIPITFIAWNKWGSKIFKRLDLWVITLFSILPFVFWRLWMSQYPEGIPQNAWLFNEGGIRFKGAFFHWIFAQRIGELILGMWGLVLLTLGIIIKKRNFFYLSFLVSSLLYLLVIARGNVQHSYYQILIMPTIVVYLALGSNFLINPPKEYISRRISRTVFVVCTIFALAFSWFNVRDYYNINNPSILVAGAAVDRLVPKDAKVVAPLEGDTTLLYYTKRKGWASFSKPLPQLIRMGASYLVLVNPKEEDLEISKKYKIIEKTKDYLIFDLKSQ